MSNKLIKTITKEMDCFKSEILKLSPQDIFVRAYEITCKNEIFELLLCDEDFLTRATFNKLCKITNPIQWCYEKWLESDGGIHEPIRSCLEGL